MHQIIISKHPVYYKQGPITIYHNKSINTIQLEKIAIMCYEPDIKNHRPSNKNHIVQTKEQRVMNQISKFQLNQRLKKWETQFYKHCADQKNTLT